MDGAERIAEIRRRLQAAFNPEMLVVEDEGHLHIGHEGARDGRGHFRLLIVAKAFEGMTLLQRHRSIYAELGSLMETDIHALAIEAFSEEEI